MIKTETLHTLIDEQTLTDRIRGIASDINRDYAGKNPILLCILSGSFRFTAELTRFITIPVNIDFIGAASYVGKKSAGEIQLTKKEKVDVRGRHVIIIDDIYDSGITLKEVSEYIRAKGPVSVAHCVLLVKNKPHGESVSVEYSGFSIEDRFVVGFGLDYDESFRELNYIACID